MSNIVILDFGSQSTHLIHRRLEDLGYHSTIIASDSSAETIKTYCPQGIIFSGSPDSVYEKNAPNYDPEIIKLKIPKLGICYGFQCTIHNLGGIVQASNIREYGECSVIIKSENLLFQGISSQFTTWMSHGDSIIELPKNFIILAESSNYNAAAYCPDLNFWGVQFHPELAHCEQGEQILNNFAQHICKLSSKKYEMKNIFEQISQEISSKIKNKEVLALVSGGVDSSVLAATLLKSLNPNKVHLMYIDTGLMRKNETEEIKIILSKINAKNLHIVNAKEEFFKGLCNIRDPERKRQIIGDMFVSVMLNEVKRLKLSDDFFLAQGTLYTDMIESGQGIGNASHTIKSHHNVNSPLIIEKRASGHLIEPLKNLYKDTVRNLGLYLGLPESLIFRHPFPGPGLGVRVIGEVTEEKCKILQNADAIFIDELHKRNLYTKIWQAFAVFIPIKSVGVAGDMRKYGYTIGLRAICSEDGMSADIFEFNIKDLKEISSRMTNEIPEITRVVYDISSKPPATIEWE